MASDIPRVSRQGGAGAEKGVTARPEGLHFPCSSCGADLVFQPGQTSLVCPYCGHVQDIPGATAAERRRALAEIDYRAAIERRLPNALDDIQILACPNCGAKIEVDANLRATTCPFCATALVGEPAMEQLFRAQAVVPFAITEERALSLMTSWLGSLWFAPNGLRQYARKDKRLTGIYVPYWTFDARTETQYRGLRGTVYVEYQTVTVMVDGRPQQQQQPVQKIRWTPVAGRVAREFDDVLIVASTSLPRREAEDLEPWNLGSLQPYAPEYLAGFFSEGYTVDLEDGHAMARQKMDAVIEGDIRRDIGGDAQQIQAVRTDAQGETFKHILLPVWTAAYKYSGRSFTFVVNGQTGEVQGQRPYSPWKIAGAVIVALLLILLFMWLAEQQGMLR